jgi:hypothetical protein
VWFLGLAIFSGVIANSLQGVRRTVRGFTIALVISAVVECLTLQHGAIPGWALSIGPIAAAVLLTVGVDRVCTDPTRHV